MRIFGFVTPSPCVKLAGFPAPLPGPFKPGAFSSFGRPVGSESFAPSASLASGVASFAAGVSELIQITAPQL